MELFFRAVLLGEWRVFFACTGGGGGRHGQSVVCAVVGECYVHRLDHPCRPEKCERHQSTSSWMSNH
jgi:hypothetical protein